MNTRIFEAFTAREQQVTEYMAGCGMQYGGDCTCGPDCRCKNCPIHNSGGSQLDPAAAMDVGGSSSDPFDAEPPLPIDQHMQFFGMGPPAAVPPTSHAAAMTSVQLYSGAGQYSPSHMDSKPSARSQHNTSILSYGNRGSLRGMSITSETTFGRAMSGLSALSIDWENLDDFDLEVDHSAHIGNASASASTTASGGQEHRPSIRRSIMSTGSNDGAHVSFKV
jgi:hypothetical protein